MTKLPQCSGHDCIQALERAGFYERKRKRSGGDHVFMQHDEPYFATVVPMHKTLKPGTLRAIIRQSGLTVEQFVDLL